MKGTFTLDKDSPAEARVFTRSIQTGRDSAEVMVKPGESVPVSATDTDLIVFAPGAPATGPAETGQVGEPTSKEAAEAAGQGATDAIAGEGSGNKPEGGAET